jgi:putative transposase
VEGRKGNSRNCNRCKKLRGDFGEAEIEVPRDRNGTCTPQIVAPHQRRFTGFDDKILSIYARGYDSRNPGPSGRDLGGRSVAVVDFLGDDAVVEEVQEWQSRPPEPLYAILLLDALM